MANTATLLEQLDLRGLHAPPDPAPWPPAPGWWLLTVLAAALLGYAGLRSWRAWRRARRRRRILAELASLSEGCRGGSLIAEVSALLKRVALSRFPHAEVAPLTGSDWLVFLDRTGGEGGFEHGAGRVLADGPYAPAPDCDASALLALARAWLERNT
jgi:hypothetical protein